MPQRAAGILLHPTSLPGPYGIGDLGPEVDRFFDFLVAARQTIWQVLPLGPPEIYNSPYGCLSAFAGNPLLVAPDLLVAEGLVLPDELEGAPQGRPDEVDFAAVIPWKESLLRLAWQRFQQGEGAQLAPGFAAFKADPAHAGWLGDWALYSALRERHELRPWWEWPRPLARREPAALAAFAATAAEELELHRFVQFLFFAQWRRVRGAATARGLAILGDLPIYLSGNSADVWSHPEIFELDEELCPLAVAGVPPDAFSDTGQLWGSPLFRWDVLAARGFDWWIDRVAANLRLADFVRLDHFRGFEAYWAVPAGDATAVGGSWRPGPGKALFDALRDALGELPLVAEDLGVITPEVEALRTSLALPGMAILQFGFGGDDSSHLPHHHRPDRVVYTGTHDNETSRGWWGGLDGTSRRRVRLYTGAAPREVHWGLIRLAYTSVAGLAVVPAQDLLGLGNEARMNTPGQTHGNWAWRLAAGALGPDLAAKLADLAAVTGREPHGPKPQGPKLHSPTAED